MLNADHPDPALSALLDEERWLAAAWRRSGSRQDALACYAAMEQVAAMPAVTILGVLEKADAALAAWRPANGEAVTPLAAALEDACRVLRRIADEAGP